MTKFSIRILEAVLLVAFLLVAFVAWRLSRGPLPLDPFTPYLERALTAGQPDLRLTISHASLQWRALDSRPVITVENVQATDRSGVIAALPRMDVEMSLPALFSGSLVPEEISLSSPSLRVTRRTDGSFAFGVTQTSNPSEATPDNESVASALISALTRPASDINRAGYLQRIAIRDSTLVLADEATGKRWLVPNAALILQRAGADVELSANLPIIDQNRPWNIAVHGSYSAQAKQLDMTLQLDGFRPSGISELATQLHPLRAADFPVSGEVAARLSLGEAGARMDELKFDLKAENGVLNMPAPVNRAYGVKSLRAKGGITDALDHIVLETLAVELNEGTHGPATISVSGEGLALNSAPAIGLDIAISDLTTDAFKFYWPEGVKPNTRNWVSNNLHKGELSQSRFHVALGGPRLEELDLTDLKGSSTLSGVTVTYMRQLPSVLDTAATMTLSATEVAVNIEGGMIPDAQSGKGLQVRSGTIRLTELGSAHEHARIDLNIGGDLGEVMRLIDHEPLGYAQTMGIDPSTPTGAADIDLSINFPLIAELKLDQLQIGVKAKVNGGKIPKLVFDQPLDDSHLELKLDGKGMDVSGTAVVAGIPASIVWRENFGGGNFRSRYEIDTTLDNDQRPLVALTSRIFAPPYIDGPVKAHIVYTSLRDGTSTVEADADLHDSIVSMPLANWTKAKATAGRATISATFRNGEIVSVPGFHVVSEDGDLNGTAQFSPGSLLTRVDVAKARLGETDVSLGMTLDDRGVYHYEVRGAAFDAATFFKELNRDDGSDPNAPKTPITMRAKLDRMWMSKEGDFRDVSLTYRQSARDVEAISLTSKVDGIAPLTFELSDVNGKRTFHGTGTSGGSVVRAIGLFDDIVGGTFKIDGDIEADGVVKGTANISDLKLVKAPAIARLLSVAAVTGIVDELEGKGLSFKMLRVPFTYSDSVVHVTNGEMFGTSLGLTGKGTYNFTERNMDFEGTVIPAYAVNSALSSIPLLGTLLTGTDKGGGIIAAAYTYKGDPLTAQPSVNPLTVLAPGIMRRIFDIFKSTPAQSAQNPERAKAPKAASEEPADG